MLARILQLLTKLPMPFSRSSPEKTTQFGIIKKKVQVPISQNTRCFNPSEKYAQSSNWIHLPPGNRHEDIISLKPAHGRVYQQFFSEKIKTTSSCQCLSWNLGTGFHFAHRSTQIPSARTKQAVGADFGSFHGELWQTWRVCYREDPPGATKTPNGSMVESINPHWKFCTPKKT